MGFLDRLRGKPTPDDFAAMVIRALRQAGDTRDLRNDPRDFRVLTLEGDQAVGVTNLHNFYKTYLHALRNERSACLRAVVRTARSVHRELPEDFETARPDLRPKLWSRTAVEKQRLRDALDGDRGLDPPAVPVGEHLLACLAYDWPESTQSVAPDDLGRWGVSLYEALEVAWENLDETTKAYSKVGDHLASFLSGDSYDAGRILVVDRIRDLSLAGRPVAMVPNRDAAYVTGEDDDVGLTMLSHLAAEGLKEGYPLSGVPPRPGR